MWNIAHEVRGWGLINSNWYMSQGYERFHDNENSRSAIQNCESENKEKTNPESQILICQDREYYPKDE
jgi:hypothetical protein